MSDEGRRAASPRRAQRVCYFAYGSNLDVQQMLQRCPSARLVARAFLPDHVLAFVGHSPLWSGAVATVVPVPGFEVDGVVYRITRKDLRRLDVFEGCPVVYRRETRAVIDEQGRWRRVVVYLHAADLQPGAPSRRYLERIAEAYRRHGFDVGGLRQALRHARRAAPRRQ